LFVLLFLTKINKLFLMYKYLSVIKSKKAKRFNLQGLHDILF